MTKGPPESAPRSQEGPRVGRVAKTAFFQVLVMASAYWYGLVCHQVLWGVDSLLGLVLQVLLALGLLLVAMGVTAVLVRPLGILLLVFALASLTFFLALGPDLASGVMILLFLLVAANYGRQVTDEMENYVRFTLRPVAASQFTVILVLVGITSTTFYQGYAPTLQAEGVIIPPSAIADLLEGTLMGRVAIIPGAAAEIPAEAREQVRQMAEEQAQQLSTQLQEVLRPYTPLIAAGMALGLFFVLFVSANLLNWVPIFVLRLILAFFAVAGVTHMVTETREVQRIVME